jgi:charged multivesicular body protein 2A
MFGGKSKAETAKAQQQVVRDNQRLLKRSMRELEKECAALQAQEKRLIMDIKKNSKAGQTNSVKILAHDLVRTRRNVEKFLMLKAHLQAVSLRLQTITSNQSMSSAMVGVTQVGTHDILNSIVRLTCGSTSLL